MTSALNRLHPFHYAGGLLAAALTLAPATAQESGGTTAPQQVPDYAKIPLPQHQDLSTPFYHPRRPRTEAEHKVAKWGPRGMPSPAYAVLAERVFPMTSAPIHKGIVLIKDSMIVAVGKQGEVEIPEGYEVMDMGNHWLMPGFVDLHCHIASRSFDLNDTIHQTNPEFRTLDLITLEEPQVKLALAGGISSVLYIPGSGSNMGGFGTLTKTAGRSPEEALIRFPGSLKIAQAGNPERRAGDLGMTRMGMNQNLRFTLERGRVYYEAWEAFDRGEGPKPEFDAALENLRGLFRHEYPVSVHTQIYQVVLSTLRELRTEMDLWTVVVHGTFDAYRLTEEAAKLGVVVANGPRQYHFDRATSQIIGLADAWYAGGQHGWKDPVRGLGRDGIAINTDSPVIAQEELTLQTAMAVRLGLPWEIGLLGITINPARMAGIDHRVGSLEPGKDADLGIWSGDPLDPSRYVELMVINGRIVYRRNPERPVF